MSIARSLASLTTRAKIGLAFGVLMLIGFTLVGWLAGRSVDRQLTEVEAKRLTESAARMARSLDVGMFERLREVSNLAEAASSGRVEDALERSDLERLKSTFPYYAWIGVTDDKGTVLSATSGVLEGKDVSARPWWQGAVKAPVAGDPHDAVLLQYMLPPRADGEPLRLFDVAAPIRIAGRLSGVLGAHLSWEWAAEARDHVLAGMDPTDAIELFVFNPRGENMSLSKTAPKAKPLVADMTSLAGRDATEQAWSDGARYLTAAVRSTGYRDYSGLGWIVVVRQPIELTAAPAARLRATIWAIGAVGALLVAVLGWWSSGQLLRPLREVADAAQAVSPSATEAGGDEVRKLSRALGDLVARLRLRESDLLQLNGQLEQRVLDRTAELELRNADLRGMTRMVMHDVRAPMGSILQALGMAAKADPERQREWLDIVTSEAQHVSEVVDALMALSTAESRPLTSETVDMCALVSASVSRHRIATGYAGEILLDSLPAVRGDAVLIGQVWDNLIGNAMKFSRLSRSPVIHISSESDSDERVRFNVEDNGVGFAAEQANRLFTAFERLHEDGRYPGTGLGLSIVQRIVQRHGGEVTARGETGRGARFTFSIPKAS